MSQYPPFEQPAAGWQQPYPQPVHQPPPPRRRRRRILLVLVLVVVLVVAAATTIVLVTRDVPGDRAATPYGQAGSASVGGSQDHGGIPTVPVDIPGWREGDPITAEALHAVPPEQFFWTVYKRHTMVPVQELIQEPWIAPPGKPVASGQQVTPHVHTIRTIINYQTKQFAKATTARNASGQVATLSICVNGTLFMRTETALETGRPYTPAVDEQSGAKDCPLILDEAAFRAKATAGLRVNDAFLTGGLTGDQADRMIDCLREWKLVSVTKLGITDAGGKRFVAIEGEVNRVEDKEFSPDTKVGTYLLRQCFDDATGLDQRFHPYPFTVGDRQGLQWVYYLDPTSLRPAYSKVQTTPVLALDGSVSPDNAEYNESVSWVQWVYPPTVPTFTLADGEQPLTVAWPVGLPGK